VRGPSAHSSREAHSTSSIEVIVAGTGTGTGTGTGARPEWSWRLRWHRLGRVGREHRREGEELLDERVERVAGRRHADRVEHQRGPLEGL